MTAILTPQVRRIALIGLAAFLAVSGGMFTLLRNGPDTIESSRAAAGGSVLASPVAATPKPAPVPASEEAAPVAAPAAKPAQAAPAEKEKPPVAPNGLPWGLDAALQRNEVVVVALYTPGGRVDKLSLAEARAGAETASAGFVALNALEEAQGGALARLYGIVDAPSLLVFRHPDVLAMRIDGFADAETVAQAAVDAGR